MNRKEFLKTSKEPIALTEAVRTLVKLGEGYGIGKVHHAYAEAIAELMACQERDAWRNKIVEGQREMFAMLEKF